MHTSTPLRSYAPNPYEVGACSTSRQGVNEDSYFIGSLKPCLSVSEASPGVRLRGELMGPHRGLIMIVADGVNNLDHGAIASRLAVEEAAGYALENVVTERSPIRLDPGSLRDSRPRLTLPGIREQLVDAITASDEKLRHQAREVGELGSSLTLGYLLWPLLYIAHVGDSRAYVVKGSQLLQITRDHSLGAQAAALGFDDLAGKWHNALWNCLGDPHRCAAPDLHKVVLEPHDRWLFTSSGFHEHTSPGSILELALESQSASTIAHNLARYAMSNGARNDVTVIFGRYIWE